MKAIKIEDAKYYYIYRVIKYTEKYMCLINMPKNNTVHDIVYILQCILKEDDYLKDKSFYEYKFTHISFLNNFGPFSEDLEVDLNIAYNNIKFDLELSPLMEYKLKFLEKEFLSDKKCTHNVISIIARILSTIDYSYSDHLKKQYSDFICFGNYKCDYNDIYTAICKITQLKKEYDIFLKAYDYINEYILKSLEYFLHSDIDDMTKLLNEISEYKLKR